MPPSATGREALERLWMERQNLMPTLARIGDLTDPGAPRLESEARGYLRDLEAGKIVWPPVSPPFGGEVKTRWENFLTHERPFSPSNLLCFSLLPSVETILSRVGILLAGEGMPEADVRRVIALTLSQVHALYMWNRFGSQVYVVDPETLHLLGQTEFPRLKGSALRFPRQSFFLRFPKNLHRFAVEEDPTPQPVEGILVSVDEMDAASWRDVNYLLVGRSKFGAAEDNCLFGGFGIDPQKSLANLLTDGTGQTGGAMTTTGQSLTGIAIRSVVNLLLYLQSRHPLLEPVPPAPRQALSAVKNPAKRRKAEARNNRLSRHGYLYVGGKPASSSDGPPPREGGGKWSLDRRISVAAHWRNQPCGPGGRDRELIWVKEHERGPDMADAISLRIDRVQSARRKNQEALPNR